MNPGHGISWRFTEKKWATVELTVFVNLLKLCGLTKRLRITLSVVI